MIPRICQLAVTAFLAVVALPLSSIGRCRNPKALTLNEAFIVDGAVIFLNDHIKLFYVKLSGYWPDYNIQNRFDSFTSEINIYGLAAMWLNSLWARSCREWWWFNRFAFLMYKTRSLQFFFWLHSNTHKHYKYSTTWRHLVRNS